MSVARERGTSFAQVVREALAEYLGRREARWDRDPISAHIGSIVGPDTDLAESHDRYLYDD